MTCCHENAGYHHHTCTCIYIELYTSLMFQQSEHERFQLICLLVAILSSQRIYMFDVLLGMEMEIVDVDSITEQVAEMMKGGKIASPSKETPQVQTDSAGMTTPDESSTTDPSASTEDSVSVVDQHGKEGVVGPDGSDEQTQQGKERKDQRIDEDYEANYPLPDEKESIAEAAERQQFFGKYRESIEKLQFVCHLIWLQNINHK